jgi:hypothetical protein
LKVDKELVQAAQWRLFEGSGEIRDVNAALLEAMQWIQFPQDPKPELPWFNPEGHFRLPQVHRELKGYQCLIAGDTEGAKTLGVRERVLKWNLDPAGVARSRQVLDLWSDGFYTEDTAKLLLKSIWLLMRKRS